MTKKIYRTAQGKMVDLGALQLRNENVRAVGNMSVNARGDLVDGWNRPIETKNNNIKKSYDRQISNVSHESVTKDPVRTSTKKPRVKESKSELDSKVKVGDQVSDTKHDGTDEQPSGLAAAIAKARSIRETPIQTPAELSKHRAGVKKI